MGGSFVPKGGQNPLEPIRYGCYVPHGKHTFNLTEIYNILNKKRLSYKAKNTLELRKLILSLLMKASKKKGETNKFRKIGSNILQKNFRKIRVLI